MAKVIRVVVQSVRNIGMVHEMVSLCATRPARKVPRILTSREAIRADRESLARDWIVTCSDYEKMYSHEVEGLNV